MSDYKYDADARYQKSDEWARLEDGVVVVGISDYAQHQLSDVVFVELPEVGQVVAQGEDCAVVESVKAAADVVSPVSGEVVDINEALEDTPEMVNDDAFGAAWFFKVAPSDVSELDFLMDAEAYAAYNETREDH